MASLRQSLLNFSLLHTGRHERRAAVHEVRLSAKAQLAEQGVLSLEEDASTSSDSDSTVGSTSGESATESATLQLDQFLRAFHVCAQSEASLESCLGHSMCMHHGCDSLQPVSIGYSSIMHTLM